MRDGAGANDDGAAAGSFWCGMSGMNSIIEFCQIRDR